MDSARIAALCQRHALPSFRQKQLAEAIFTKHVRSFAEVSTLAKDLREKISAEESMLSCKVVRLQSSIDKRTHKVLLEFSDGKRIESVLMSPKPGLWTACISSQVGCAMKCSFCATGSMGLIRHLKSEEITDQVLFWRHFISEKGVAERLNNVVYMGMGEPFHNLSEVFASIRELTNPDTFNIGDRHISVSTSGLVNGIAALARDFPQVNLAISLHAANDELRSKMMPINKAHNLDKLSAALDEYIAITRRRVFIEYIMLDGENDSAAHADELGHFLRRLERPELAHVNLIVYNRTASSHRESPRDRARLFCERLEQLGVSASIRKNLGRDIDGACGQLAVKEGESSQAPTAT